MTQGSGKIVVCPYCNTENTIKADEFVPFLVPGQVYQKEQKCSGCTAVFVFVVRVSITLTEIKKPG